PRRVLVLALRGDVPDRAGAADGERQATGRGRMEHVVDVLFGRAFVERRVLPSAVDPAALEEQRERALAFALAHRRPGLCAREDLLWCEPAAVCALVVVEGLADRVAISDPFAALVDDVAAVGPHQRHERVVRGAGVTGLTRIEGVGDHSADLVL